MVRLKVPGDSFRINLNAFQFLMVRLKEMLQYAPQEFYLFQFLMVRLKVYRTYITEQGMKFQFLMVRLKDDEGESIFNRKKISIPYGSIKSFM